MRGIASATARGRATLAVAAGLWLASASTAQGVDAIRVRVGGYMEQSFGYAHNSSGVRVSQQRGTSLASVVVAKPNRWSQQSDAEIWFTGRATLANGITLGFKVELEANSQVSDQIDESYLFIDGAFGRLLIGSENDTAYLQHVGAPRAGDGWGILESPVSGWVYRPRFTSAFTTTAPLSTGDEQKLTYFTPRLAGAQFGISYTPNPRQDVREFADTTRERTNVWSLSLGTRHQVGPVQLRASLGWVGAPGAGPSAPADDRRRLDDWAIGGQASLSGATFGVGYRQLRNPGGSDAGTALSIGGAQEFAGGIAVGVGYLRSRVTGLANLPAEHKAQTWLLSGSMRLAPGISALGAVFAARYAGEDPRFTRTDSNRGAGLTTGIRLSF
jgi:predicted porin